MIDKLKKPGTIMSGRLPSSIPLIAPQPAARRRPLPMQRRSIDGHHFEAPDVHIVPDAARNARFPQGIGSGYILNSVNAVYSLATRNAPRDEGPEEH